VMPERRKYDAEFREGAVTIVRETGRPIAEVARDLGIGAGTLGELGEEGPPRPGRGS
jgi:transposase